MSGRRFTSIAVAICLLLVAIAFWQRTQSTQRIREFWGAHQASLIQHAPQVFLRSPGQADAWQDISQSPGLVHLRATLVDDRYYQWPARQRSQPDATATAYRLRFQQQSEQVELFIEPSTGAVTNSAKSESVPLIPASQKAVALYLEQITR